MPNRFTVVVMGGAMALASSAALAQQVSPLTVQAAPDPKLIDKQSRSFVQNYAATANPQIDQIARWHGSVCIQVSGLPVASQAAEIRARMRA